MTDDQSDTLTLKTRLGILLSTVLVVVAIDQWSKFYAVANWRGLPPQSYFGDFFRIEYAENRGAFLSLFANMPDEVRFWILTVLNAFVLMGVAAWLVTSRRTAPAVFIPFSLFVAGGIGNVIDRVRLGYVIDFFNVGLGNLRTGIFNVADMAITTGFIMMLPLLFRGEAAETKPSPRPEMPSEAA